MQTQPMLELAKIAWKQEIGYNNAWCPIFNRAELTGIAKAGIISRSEVGETDKIEWIVHDGASMILGVSARIMDSEALR